MRGIGALSGVTRKVIIAIMLMLGSTGIIFFALRAAPGTALDAYTSLNTPIEDIAVLRQELGLTLLEPLKTRSGNMPLGLELHGAYQGDGSVNVEIVISRVDGTQEVGRLAWSTDDQGVTQIDIREGQEVPLSDGFSVKIRSLSSAIQEGAYDFSAINLDGRPIRAYYEWLARVCVGDFGKSQTVSPSTDVMQIAAPAFLKTLSLAILALLICMLFCTVLVVVIPQGRGQLYFNNFLTSLGAAPSFVVGLFVMLLVNQFGQSYWDPEMYVPPIWYPLPTVIEDQFVLMPAVFAGLCIVLGDGLFADYLNTFRSEFENVRSAPFIAAIRSKGASVTRHMVTNLIVPTVDAFAGRLPLVLGSVIIVETMFGLTGGGWYLLEAAKRRDVPLVVGLSVLFTATGIVVHLLAEVVKALVDPREADHGA